MTTTNLKVVPNQPSDKGQSEIVRLSNILDHLPVLVSYLDTSHIFRYNNRAYENYLNIPLSQIINRHIQEVIGAEAYEARKTYIEKALGGETIAFEIETSHPEGIRYTAVSYVPDFDVSKKVIGVVCLIYDITAVKKAEIALVSSRDQYRTAVDVGQIGTWEYSPQNDYPIASERLRGLFDCSESNFPQTLQQLKNFLPPNTRREAFTHLAKLRNKNNYSFELEIVTVTGKHRWLSLAAQVNRGADATLKNVFIAAIDITPQKEILLAQQRLLQHEILARTTAETQNRLKDDFLATVSHELRTPLNGILGWAQYLKRVIGAEPKAKEGLNTIERLVLTQASLVSDLLDMSSLSAGGLALNLEKTSVPRIIEESVDAIRPTSDEKNIMIQQDILNGETFVLGDKRRLGQVITNLLNNSIKFSDSGTTIDIAVFADGDSVSIEVRDHGIGIAASFLPQVFGRFKQADPLSGKRSGVGIGLALCKQLIEMHDGSIEAKSEGIGLGSSFCIKLPKYIP